MAEILARAASIKQHMAQVRGHGMNLGIAKV